MNDKCTMIMMRTKKKIKALIDQWWMQNNSDAHEKDKCPNCWTMDVLLKKNMHIR